MAYAKHQTECYRTIKGQKYINWCDVLDENGEAALEACKMRKIPHRAFKHPDGFIRLFVREDMAHKLT